MPSDSRQALHSSANDSHLSPALIVEPARLVLGGSIDLDPATSGYANRLIGAREVFTRRDNGLRRDWFGRVFLNPPGGVLTPRQAKRYGTKSRAVLWWLKLLDEHESGRVSEALFVGFSLELLQACQVTGTHPCDFPHCIPRKRLRFELQLGRKHKRKVGKAPTHSNIVVYLPPKRRRLECGCWLETPSITKFRELFSQAVGRVWVPGCGKACAMVKGGERPLASARPPNVYPLAAVAI